MPILPASQPAAAAPSPTALDVRSQQHRGGGCGRTQGLREAPTAQRNAFTAARETSNDSPPAQKLSSSYKQLIIDGVLVAAWSCAQAYPPRLGIKTARPVTYQRFPATKWRRPST